MKNLVHYNGDSFDFFKKVVHRKQTTKADPDFKTRITALESDVKFLFEKYDDKFRNNKLEDLVPFGYSAIVKADLEKLYSYSSKAFQDLKIELTTGADKRIINTCWNCTIGEVNSFDHYLPQSEFIEFIVHPKNLIPSCSKCNSSKTSIWLSGSTRSFINLYIDVLPREQFLFVDLIPNSSQFHCEFYLRNLYGIDQNIFNLIESHYNKLNLLKRFKENIHVIVSELQYEIEIYRRLLPMNEIINAVLEKCDKVKTILGFNHWKAILESTLVTNNTFMSQFI